jgi:O-antigen ligase
MNIELFFFYLYGAGSPLSIFVQNLCLAVIFLFSLCRLLKLKVPVEKELLFFFVFLASQIVAAFFSIDKTLGWKGVRDNWALLAGFVAAYGLSKYASEKLFTFQFFLSIGAMLAASMAVIQFFFGTDFQKQRLFSVMPMGSMPSKGFFTHHLTFAGFMGMVFLFLTAEILYGKRKSVYIAGASAALLSLFLSQSRGYLLILIVCLPFLLWKYSKRYILRASLLAACALVVIVLISPAHIKTRALNLFSMKNGSFAERVYLFKSGIEMAAKRPVFGWGPGSYMKYSGEFKAKYNEKVVYPDKVGFNTKSHAHNSYLMVLIESGVVGLAGYISFLAFLLISIIRSRNYLRFGFIAVYAYFLLGGLFEYNLGDAEVAGFFAFLMGLAAALKRNDAD